MVGSEGLDGYHVLYCPVIYHCIITHDARAKGPGLVVSLAYKIFISAWFAGSIVRHTMFNGHKHSLEHFSQPAVFCTAAVRRSSPRRSFGNEEILLFACSDWPWRESVNYIHLNDFCGWPSVPMKFNMVLCAKLRKTMGFMRRCSRCLIFYGLS